MAERYGDFMWDYYGGRPFRGDVSRQPVSWMRAMAAGQDGPCGDMNRETSRDMEYFQTMYPERMRRIQNSINDLCDTIDYEGSFLYDEYPDRVSLRRLCSQIYEKELEEGTGETEAEWLKAAIEVLLYHEICRRRVRRRGMRRKYWL